MARDDPESPLGSDQFPEGIDLVVAKGNADLDITGPSVPGFAFIPGSSPAPPELGRSRRVQRWWRAVWRVRRDGDGKVIWNAKDTIVGLIVVGVIASAVAAVVWFGVTQAITAWDGL